MSVQRYLRSGKPRYRARVKWHGCEVATRVFTKRADAVTWEQEQQRRLRLGEWIDPRRGSVPLSEVAIGWLQTRQALKRRTAETDRGAWRLYVEPRFGKRPVNSITAAEVREWSGGLVASGLAPSTASRALATLRSVLTHALADERITVNVAAAVPSPRGRPRREGQGLDEPALAELAAQCRGHYADVVLVLGYTGLRWGELAGLRSGDVVAVPGPGLRVQRAVLASHGGGKLYVDTVKTSRARTVPLVAPIIPIVEHWARGKSPADPLFPAPSGGYLREGNWKRSVGWSNAKRAVCLPDLRVHDLRHTAATIWLANGADPKVVQRILGHATATMTMDLYGHLIDTSLWEAARRIGGTTGAREAKVIGGSDV